jgi:predicted protein tyrosine phosphatase
VWRRVGVQPDWRCHRLAQIATAILAVPGAQANAVTPKIPDGMPYLYVCSLSGLSEVAAGLDRFDLLTLLSPGHEGENHRTLGCDRHLQLSFHDITEKSPGLVAPDSAIMQAVLDFARGARDRKLLIHCWAGISRSSAASYAIACDRNPGFELEIAEELRRRAPSVTPNRLMVSLADDLLGRNGRMTEAIHRVGRGADAFEGEPYRLPLSWPIE